MPSEALTRRAGALLEQGLTPLRTARRLKREFPTVEKLDIDAVAGLGPSGYFPLWAQHGRSLRPVICRIDPRR